MRKRLSGKLDELGGEHHRPGFFLTQRWFVHVAVVSLAAIAFAGCGGNDEPAPASTSSPASAPAEIDPAVDRYLGRIQRVLGEAADLLRTRSCSKAGELIAVRDKLAPAPARFREFADQNPQARAQLEEARDLARDALEELKDVVAGCAGSP